MTYNNQDLQSKLKKFLGLHIIFEKMSCISNRQKLKSQSISNFFYFQIILLRIYCHVILSTQVNINLTAVNVLAMKWHALTIERKDQCVSLVEDAKQSCLL